MLGGGRGGVTCGASSGGGNVASTKRLLQQADTPWYVGFQTNERTLEWEESAGVQMIKLYCCQKTGQVGRPSLSTLSSALLHVCVSA